MFVLVFLTPVVLEGFLPPVDYTFTDKHTTGFCVHHTQLPTPSKSSPLLTIAYLATVLINSNNTPPHFQITGW